MRSIADDERDLCPVENEATESPCANGATCCAIIDIAGGPGMPLRALAPTLKFVFFFLLACFLFFAVSDTTTREQVHHVPQT
tara:strand:- start:408 stop:653 length:246 start_codon:yes stop_codon:yes gene_type:complete